MPILASLRAKFSPHAETADLSAREQSAASGASDEVLQALADGNARYEARFGHVFLICATGKSAEEMLASLEKRVAHAPEQELAIASGEQRKITRLRLETILRDTPAQDAG